MRWFVNVSGQTTGPHGEETLRQWAELGRLPLTAQVRDEHGGSWMALRESPLAPLVEREIERADAQAERGVWMRLLLLLLVFGGLWFGSCAVIADHAGCGK